MINNEELRISNKSYVNKDFGVIYPEVLDTTKTMTDRWDPETTNESDPGIVLLKLLSFIADKNNYNIDKNALENFMLSATQESSMRKLCDMLGYPMNYYIAPSVKLTISYLGEGLDNEHTPISFKALSTVFGSADENETIEYVLIQDCNLQESNKSQEKIALQGKLKVLNVNTSGTETSTNESLSTIQLSNLDDNNRIYFPETNVAQNGVFVMAKDNTSSDYFWKVVDNLNYYTYPNTVFKFGYDSIRNLPYIEFPNYIASIIGSGLYINYIVTDGVDGDIKANVINALISSSFDWDESEYSQDNLYVRNASASFGGANPESINSAYNGFKKTIGTFNTLVTCRDYANAIYNMYDSTNSFPLVSNVQVCDRRDDFNYSQRVVSYDASGETTTNITPSDTLSAYDLCCYTLKPIYNLSKPEYFNDSFKPLTVDGSTLTSSIKNNLEENKTISHDYKTLDDEIVYLFKNMLGLSAKIVTKYKVNTNEQVEILNNIKMNLIKNFNSREVDYGVEIPYDSLVNCIESADERISQVALDEPSLKTKVMTRDGDEFDLISTEGKNAYLQLLVQNILNGNISLFEFDDDFNFDLGESQIDDSIPMVNKEIATLSTQLNMTLQAPTGETRHKETLKKNEVVQIIYPSVVTELTYPAYCYYRFIGNGTTSIAQNIDYVLKENEKLYMSYTDSNTNSQICKEYGEGTIVKTIGATIYDANSVPPTESQKPRELPNHSVVNFVTMPNSSQSIEIRKKNQTQIKTRTPCYWLLNDEDNEINFSNYVLQEGEYFFYTDESHTQLIALGSGTSLSGGPTGTYTCDRVSVEEVFEEGLTALESKWQYIQFSAHNLTITENSIVTLTENDSVWVDDGVDLTLSNTLQSIDTRVIGYNFEDDDAVLLDGTSGVEYEIKSRLDIDVAKDEPQVIDTEHGQKIELTFRDSSTLVLGQDSVVDTNGIYFNFNAPLQLSGRDNIDMIIKVVGEGSEEVDTWPYSIYCYNDQIEDNESVNPSINPGRSSFGYASYELSSIGDGGYNPALTFNLPIVNGESAILMIHVNMIDAEESDKLVLSVPSNCCYEIKKYNQGSYSNTLDMYEGINVIDIHYKGSGIYGSSPTLTISNSTGKGGVLTLGTLDFVKDYNSALGIEEYEDSTLSSDIVRELLTKIGEIDTQGLFYYNNKIENSKIIESSNLLSPYAFYDVNNRANKITLSQIDFSKDYYNIEIMRSSRL